MSRIFGLLSVSVLIVSVLGCQTAATHSEEGRLDLVIRPDSAAASSRPVQGEFVVRSLERKGTERVDVNSAYETRSVPLQEGAYVLEWRPELPLRISDDPAVWARELSEAAVQPLVIHAGRVTTVQVRAALEPARSGERLTMSHDLSHDLADDLPSVEIRVARR